MYFHKNI